MQCGAKFWQQIFLGLGLSSVSMHGAIMKSYFNLNSWTSCASIGNANPDKPKPSYCPNLDPASKNANIFLLPSLENR